MDDIDPFFKVTIQDFPDTPRTGDGLCQECYESFGSVGRVASRVPRISKLRISSRSCAGCRALLDFFVAAQRQSSRPISFTNPVDLRRSWAYWVNEYSRVNTPANEEHAFAILGLINFVQRLKKDEPLLGLWKEDLAEGLLWERGVWSEPAGRRRITPYPSWSWMSLPGAVQYPNFSLSTKEIELVHPRICWSSQPLNSSLEIAELLLRGKVLRGILTYHGRESPASSLHLDIEGFSKMALFERIDIPDAYYENTTVKLIVVGSTREHWFFLIASVVNPERNPYVRIGRAYSTYDPHGNTFRKLEEYLATVESQMFTLR